MKGHHGATTMIRLASVGRPRGHALPSLALLCLSLVLAAADSEDDRTDIGTVHATGGPDESSAVQSTPGSAGAVAPSRPPLDAAQPTSVVGPTYIQNNTVPTQNYDNIIKFSPSVQNVEPTGAGLQQNFNETIRGFRYTQFNSTFDGLVLPGTISSFAPQTAAYFLAHDIASVSVDRGPGTASQIGYATFGGTVATTLTTPGNTFGINPYATFGSFGVKVEGLRLDSGALPALGGARGLLDSAHVEGNGYLTGTSTLRNNIYAKVEAPIGDNTVITAVGMYDYARTHTPYGATSGQIQSLGANYALNGNLLSQAYSGYNTDNYYTDFDYLGVKSAFGDGWGIDDKVYTVSYYHNGTNGLDPNGTTPNLTGTYFINGVRTTVTNDVPGITTHSDFRSIGNTLRVTRDTDYGQVRSGLWLDYNAGSSYKAAIDLSDNGATYTRSRTGTPFKSLYNTTLTTVQPYLEFAAKPLPGLTITLGIKYTYVSRGLNATIIGSAPSTAPDNQSWSAVLPAIDARYEVMKGWVAYAQVADGFLAPPLNALLVPAANAPSSLKPQQTINYQVGTTFQNDRFAAGFDMYYINFQNYIASQNNSIGTIYSNNGGAVFKGIEAEGTAKLGRGVSLYANATLNDATYDGSGFPVALNPRSTTAAGPILQRNGFYGSFLWKYVGPQYTLDGSGPFSHASFPIRGYNDADFAASYTLLLPQINNRSLNFRLNVLNVFNNHSLAGLIGTTANNQALYATNPGRAVFVSISAAL
ncbi:TonB-dependent receptor [Rhodopila sp.]|uniref:TonB-dependent receptor n=1 Tax=Rhodopila sp. TaxID=2480087 RepID=UPI003D0E18C9